MPRIEHVILSCEHAGNRVPAAYRALFAGRERLLDSHRGWDPGALEVARRFARTLHAPLHACTATRLLIDPNRSLDSPTLHSDIVRTLDEAARVRLIERHYTPHRAAVEADVFAALQRTTGGVLHLSVHSFTPVFRGVRRTVDIGLLFDPARKREVQFCQAWQQEIERRAARLRVRMNEPYRGDDDGLTTTLRARFRTPRYLGIELEVNQRFPRRGGPRWAALQALLDEALRSALGSD